MEYRVVDTLKQELEARSITPVVAVKPPAVKDDLGLGDPGDCKVCQELQDEFRKNPGGNKPKNIGLIIAGAIGGLGVAISAICIPFVTPALRRVCLPYVPATDTQVSNVLKALSNRSGTVLDIGSGDGRIVLATAKQGFFATGVELNRWLVYYSKYKARIAGLSRQTGFYRTDLWKHDLQKYDNIVIFGVEQMMADLEKKMVSEVKSDSLVVACRFKFPGLKPEKEIGSGVDTVWTYKMPS